MSQAATAVAVKASPSKKTWARVGVSDHPLAEAEPTAMIARHTAFAVSRGERSLPTSQVCVAGVDSGLPF